jgi:hypothetical protein
MDINRKIRTLSEDFYSRSPDTQKMIKFFTNATPTSKRFTEYYKSKVNAERYAAASAAEKQVMEHYGMTK